MLLCSVLIKVRTYIELLRIVCTLNKDSALLAPILLNAAMLLGSKAATI
jgi:hypothetical protein